MVCRWLLVCPVGVVWALALAVGHLPGPLLRKPGALALGFFLGLITFSRGGVVFPSQLPASRGHMEHPPGPSCAPQGPCPLQSARLAALPPVPAAPMSEPWEFAHRDSPGLL